MTVQPAREGRIAIATDGGLRLRSGARLPSVEIAYAYYGRAPEEAPVVLVCHALTGNARVADWWGPLVGPGRLLDPDTMCVFGTNVIGGCYGSTGPGSLDITGRRYGSRFPLVTVEDMVAAAREALTALGIDRIAAVIGGSLGGMQALQWGAAFADSVDGVIAVGATGRLSPMGIGLNAIGREAIRLDPAFQGGDYDPADPPTGGLRIARMVGMLSYKSGALLWQRHGRRPNRGGEDPAASLSARFDVEGYLHHQGDKLAARLDANTYLVLTKAMDLYDLDPSGWRVPALMVGISSDWLYPPAEVRETAAQLAPHARYVELESAHGHDGFLADPEQLAHLARAFLDECLARNARRRPARRASRT